MVSLNYSKAVSVTDGKYYIEGECLSTDTKPTTGIANGSKLLEMDTSTLYVFDEENETWRAW